MKDAMYKQMGHHYQQYQQSPTLGNDEQHRFVSNAYGRRPDLNDPNKNQMEQQ